MIYSDTISPPQGYEIVQAAADMLRADSDLEAGLGGPGRIFEHRLPAGRPDRYIVVREPIRPMGREHFERIFAMPFQVMAECSESHPRPDQFLSAVHSRIYAVLTYESPQGDASETLLPVRRMTRPSPAAYDADDHTHYSSAEYRVTLGPAQLAT